VEPSHSGLEAGRHYGSARYWLDLVVLRPVAAQESVLEGAARLGDKTNDDRLGDTGSALSGINAAVAGNLLAALFTGSTRVPPVGPQNS
jgi:hypothetical protein